MDISKYLQRIGYSHELKPDLGLLCRLQKTHLLSVPFENLDIHHGVPIQMDISRIYEKVVVNNRGGFCYELNGLFYELLIALGFDAKRISARVFNKEQGYGQEFDHLAILVNFDGVRYLADVGFGEFSFTPLKMQFDAVQKDQRGDFMIDRFEDGYFRVSKISNGESTPEYIFRDVERTFEAFGGMCHYHQTSINSPFTQKRMISVATETGRITVSGNILKISSGGITGETVLKDEAEFEACLRDHFKVRLQK